MGQKIKSMKNGPADHQVLYLVSSGHSGSTALGTLLGAQPGIEMLGEIASLSNKWPYKVCSCGKKAGTCPLWGEVLSSPKIWETKQRGVGARMSNPRLFELLSRLTRSTVLLDTSKSLRRLEVLVNQGVEPRVLYLRRNGLDVLQSKFAKMDSTFSDGVESMRLLARRWADEQEKIRQFLGSGRLMSVTLNYEKIRSDAPSDLLRLAEFLNLRSINLDSELHPSRQHQIDGNALRKQKSLFFTAHKNIGTFSKSVELFQKLPTSFWREMEVAGYSTTLSSENLEG